jgi:DnaJ-domain-containing protein 1
MMPDFLASDDLKSNLEDAFFFKEDQKLIARLTEMRKLKETKEELAKVSGITNDAVLQKLVDLNVRPETLASLSLVPLIEVAWADGEVDEDEKRVVMAAAEEMGFTKKSIDYALLAEWLQHKPPANLLEAWIHYIKGLCEKLTASEKKVLQERFIGHTRSVATASGGFLGLGNKISAAETAMLTKLDSAFSEG